MACYMPNQKAKTSFFLQAQGIGVSEKKRVSLGYEPQSYVLFGERISFS